MNEYTTNKIRLLGILYDLYSGEKTLPSENLPFSVGEDGVVVLSHDLATQLNDDKNKDLVKWTCENIASLF